MFSQVGINTITPNSSASLDVVSTSKGILYPRIALLNNTDQVTIPSPAKGLIVFNTNTSAAGSTQVVKNNLYFWNGTMWNQVVDGDAVINSNAGLKIPKLAGYAYKQDNQQIVSPTTDMIATFHAATTTSDFNNNIYMEVNPSDTTETQFKILQTGNYGFEGFACILINATTTDTIHPEICFQKSSNNGSTWTDTFLIATAEYDKDISNSLTIPINLTGVLSLTSGDLIRIVHRIRFPSTSNYTNIANSNFARSDALGVRYSVGFKAVYYPQ